MTAMKKNTLVLGGCRSGKSSHALDMANRIPGPKKRFIATSVPTDFEMKLRVKNHQNERGVNWDTLEVPLDLPETIDSASLSSDNILVDCLTLWVSNMMLARYCLEEIASMTQKLTQSLDQSNCPVILVSNEVGSGIVPGDQLSRQFRDAAGLVNQKIAASVETVILSVAGIPVTIKSL